MPIECHLLRDKPWPKVDCLCVKGCGSEPFMRGQVQSTWRKIFRKPYCAVICNRSKQIVGWEKP
jgi:hypothetical protein